MFEKFLSILSKIWTLRGRQATIYLQLHQIAFYFANNNVRRCGLIAEIISQNESKFWNKIKSHKRSLWKVIHQLICHKLHQLTHHRMYHQMGLTFSSISWIIQQDIFWKLEILWPAYGTFFYGVLMGHLWGILCLYHTK